jgi:hypothetical protein
VTTRSRSAPCPSSLYPRETELARIILGENAARWPELARVEERAGLPRIDPLYGGRYWPAVKAYLDNRHGLREHPPAATSDGGENWNGRHGQRPKP